MPADPQTALVLSGGGARGAYAVGVVQGLVEILRAEGVTEPPFQIYSGTSVGSIHSAYLGANAHLPDLGIARLRRIWTELDVNTHLRLRGTRQHPFNLRGAWFSDSVLDARPLELLVRRSVSFRDLRKNVESGLVHAAMVAAFDLQSAQTVVFSQYAPGVEVRPGRDPSRRDVTGPVTADHVLASSAMPFLFPARPLGGRYYCDGGLRFNTPISPAIRAGADRLVVISLQYQREHDERVPAHGYPTAPFIAGRVLNALLLDPFEYDLDVLGRFNRLVATLEEVLTPEELERVHQTLRETRGAPYRRLDKLVFSPTQDLGRLAHLHLEEHLASFKIGAIPRYFLKKAAQKDATWEADWAAYVLFDGRFAKTLIDLGYNDALANRDIVREFFGVPGAPASHHRFD